MRSTLASVVALALTGCLGGGAVDSTTGGDSGAAATGGDVGTTNGSSAGNVGATGTGASTTTSATSTTGAATTTGTTNATSTTGSGTSGTTATSTSGSATLTLSTGTSGTTSSTTGTTSTSGTSGTTGIHANTPLDGLTVPTLHFAVLGDCRPSNYVNNASQVPSKYPTAIITQIFQRIVGRAPDFAMFSGDMVYTYNPPDASAGAAQMDQFISARNLLDRPFAPALGNHEDTDTVNISTWSQKFHEPAYYSFTVHTNSGDVAFFVADDTYWDSRQLGQIQTWLSSSAPYHIILKHQPSDSTDNDESMFKQIIAAHPPTLILAGHSHTYDHPHPNELTLGTAGAPLAMSANGDYGYAMVDQFSGGFQVSIYNSATDALIDQWTVP